METKLSCNILYLLPVLFAPPYYASILVNVCVLLLRSRELYLVQMYFFNQFLINLSRYHKYLGALSKKELGQGNLFFCVYFMIKKYFHMARK